MRRSLALIEQPNGQNLANAPTAARVCSVSKAGGRSYGAAATAGEDTYINLLVLFAHL